MQKKSIGSGPFLVLAGALCFSTSGLSQAIAPEGASPFTVTALRLFGGGCALLLWCIWRRLLPRRGNWPFKYMLPAVLGLIGCTLFFFIGTARAGVVVGTVVTIGSIPIMSALLGMLFLGERPARAWYPATGVAILGLTLLQRGGVGAIDPLALLPSLTAAFSYAVFMVSGKTLTRTHPPETVQMVLSLLAGACLLPACFIFPMEWVLTLKGTMVALNLAVITSAMAFSLVLAGLRTTPTATASTLGLAEPLCASLMGIFYLGEPVTPSILTGLLCIFAAMIILIAFPQRNLQPSPPAA